MSIRYKLLALIALPTVIAIFFGAKEISVQLDNKKMAARIEHLAELAIHMAPLIHEIQKERGMSVGHIGSRGAKFKEELDAQRLLVDTERNNLYLFLGQFPQALLTPRIESNLDELEVELGKVQEIRHQISALSLSTGQAATFFTGINRIMLSAISDLSSLPESQEIASRLISYSMFLHAKDEAGIERAMLSAAFGADRFTPVVLKKYLSVRASQDIYIQKFKNFAQDSDITFLEDALKHASIAEVDRMRGIAEARVDSGGFGIDPVYWFGKKTEKLNQLKLVEDHISSNIIAATTRRQQEASASILFWSIILCISFVLLSCISILVMRSLIRPVKRLQEAVSDIASGNHDVHITLSSKDEIGHLAHGFNSMADNIRRSMSSLELEKKEADQARLEAETLQEQTLSQRKDLEECIHRMLQAIDAFANGDLTVQLPRHKDSDINRLFNGYNRALSRLRELIVELKEVVGKTSEISSTIYSISTVIAEEVEKQTIESSEIASISETMASGIADNAKLAGTTSSLTSQSGEVAKQGIDIVVETVEKIQSIAATVNKCVEVIERLGNSSKEINDVASVIEDIAEQTNLLALNAAIEAARAGESGKGFAVVADEVRKLAERTKDSTVQISGMITAVQQDTQMAIKVMREGEHFVSEGLSLADDALDALQDIGSSIGNMISVVGRVATSTDQEAATSLKISTLTRNIADQAQQADSKIKEIVDTLKELGSLANRVDSLVGVFVVDTGEVELDYLL